MRLGRPGDAFLLPSPEPLSIIRPHGQFVAAGVSKMKTSAAGKRKYLFGYGAAALDHIFFRLFQLGVVEHD